MRWDVKPVFEMICRLVISTAVLLTTIIITEIVLKEHFSPYFYLGFMIMLAIWVALPSLDLYKFEHSEHFKRKRQ